MIRPGFSLKCSSCKRFNYRKKRPKTKYTEKIKLNKFCKFCNSHQIHKETKK